MKTKKLLFLLMAIFTITFAYGQEKDAQLEKADALCKEGVALHDQGKYEEAIKKYDEALKVKADYLVALSEKAYSLDAMGKKSDAKKLLEKVIKKTPKGDNMTYVYLMYANILDEEGDRVKSMEMYDQALECVDASDTQMMQNILYNKAVALSKMKDDDSEKNEEWQYKLMECLDRSLRLKPYHPRSLMLMGNAMEEHGHYINALCCYAVFAMAADESADFVEPILTAWKDKELTPDSGPRTTKTLNKVKEILKKESSEYGILYDLFSEALPLACPDSLGMPVPVCYGEDIFEDAYAPFFAELHRRGLMECFCHSIMKNSKSKYISNADWLASHKSEEERMEQVFKELLTFSTELEYGYVPDSVVITNAEEARQHNIDAIACCRYYLSRPSTEAYMDEAAKFITQWSMASPDVSIKIGESEKAFLEKPELLVSYLAGCSFAALSNRGIKPADIYGMGLVAVLNRYAHEKEKIGQIDEIEKLQNLFDNDMDGFRRYVEENYNK